MFNGWPVVIFTSSQPEYDTPTDDVTVWVEEPTFFGSIQMTEPTFQDPNQIVSGVNAVLPTPTYIFSVTEGS